MCYMQSSRNKEKLSEFQGYQFFKTPVRLTDLAVAEGEKTAQVKSNISSISVDDINAIPAVCEKNAT